MSDQAALWSRGAIARYVVELGAVATAFALRVLLAPLTGTGAPFVLVFRSGIRPESTSALDRAWSRS